MTNAAMTMQLVELAAILVEGAEAELDQRLARIRRHKDDFNRAGWRIGKEVAAIMSKQLWRSRSSENKSGTTYDTFEEFCSAELGMSRRHAHRFAVISTRFTEREFLEVGVKKLTILAEAESDDRRELSPECKVRLLAEAVDMSVTELRRRLDAAAPRRNEPKVPQPEPSGVQPVRSRPKVSVELELEQVIRIPLVTAPNAPALLADFAEGKPVVGRFDVSEKIALRFALRRNERGELELVVKPILKKRLAEKRETRDPVAVAEEGRGLR